jgi:leucine dehydrogenase
MTAIAFEHVATPEYEEVRVCKGPRSGLTMVVAIHRTVDGRSLGGCRMWHYPTAGDAIRDAERLARSMTFKAAVAGLPLGGAKSVIALREGELLTGARRLDALRDFAEFVDSLGGRYITAEDVGTSVEDMGYLAQFTEFVGGLPLERGGCGDPSPFTAHGVEVGMRASTGEPLAGLHAVVIGLGHVGLKLARRLQVAGVRLTVTDVDEAKRHELPLADWVSPDEALRVDADVLVPCALGGILTRRSVAGLRVPVIAGAANTQLADESVAELLRKRAIIWAPDFVINSGGLIAVAEEHLNGFHHPDRVERAIEGIADTVREIYALADEAGTNTLIAAKTLAARRSGVSDESAA